MDDQDSRTVPSVDRLVALLAAPPRRAVLEALVRADGRLTLTRLVSTLADADGDERTVEIELHHSHLPKLDEAGLVDYDAAAGEVELSTDRTLLAERLERAGGRFEALAAAVRSPRDHRTNTE